MTHDNNLKDWYFYPITSYYIKNSKPKRIKLHTIFQTNPSSIPKKIPFTKINLNHVLAPLRLIVLTIRPSIKERATDQLADCIGQVAIVRNIPKRQVNLIISGTETKRQETTLQHVQVVPSDHIKRWQCNESGQKEISNLTIKDYIWWPKTVKPSQLLILKLPTDQAPRRQAHFIPQCQYSAIHHWQDKSSQTKLRRQR